LQIDEFNPKDIVFIFCRMLTGDDVKIESYLKAIGSHFEYGNYDRAHEILLDAIKLRRTNKITNAMMDLQLKVSRINIMEYLVTFLTMWFSLCIGIYGYDI
jgi:hypothetical protein